MENKIILAVPSKGRLEKSTANLFTQVGMEMKRDSARGYTGTVAGIETIEIQYLSASEIASRLIDGSVHMGITGEDLLREKIIDMDSAVQLCLPLGFGQADVVVAIPDGWIDATTMFDLAQIADEFRMRHGRQMRVATKYTRLTDAFFADHRISNYALVASFGATEAAPNSGAAEVIVDITSTGATLKANDLRIPEDGVILKSQANLAASLKANWHETARKAAKQMLARLAAYNKAQEFVHITLSSTPGMGEPHMRQSDISDWAEKFSALADSRFAGATSTGGSFYGFQVPQKNQDIFIEKALEFGFARATVSKMDFVFDKRNELYERLMGAVR